VLAPLVGVARHRGKYRDRLEPSMIERGIQIFPAGVIHIPRYAFAIGDLRGELVVLKQVQRFYYFVRSENDPDEDPLLLWLSGGPGCSGISGLAYEIGPLQFDAQGYRDGFPTLLYRPETWTKVRPFSSPQQCHFTEHMRLSSSESWVLGL